MILRKIYIGCALLAALAVSLCTKVDYSNPIDANGSNYISDICSSPECCDSATAITSNGIAAYYDTTSTWYQNHKGRILPQSTPVITFSGGTPSGTDSVIIAQNDPNHVLGNLGYGASDPVYGNLTSSISVVGDTFYASRCSTYVVVYSVTNPAGNTVQKTRYVIVDCGAPELTLSGSNPDSLVVGAVYHDPGATATDNIDGIITGKIDITPTTINTSVVGIDTVTYSVSDRAGNKTTVKRTVVIYRPLVKDTIAPVITLNGNNPMTVALNAAYIEPGATAIDNLDGDISTKISITGTVNTAVANTYTKYYNVSDNAGNAAVTKTRTVIVTNNSTDSTPVITLKGKNPDTVKVGPGTYTDPGCTAMDPADGDLTASVKVTELYGKSLPINTGSVGTYVLVYTVSNKTGTKTASATRYVYVVSVSNDVTPPVIFLIGAVSCTVLVGKKYTDPGYSASDNIDGIITNKVLRVFKDSSGAVADSNTFFNTPDQYSITYTVSDAAGNPATAVFRHILVQDTTGFGSSLKIKYGVPLATALPTINAAYKTTPTVDGKGGPNMSTVTTFTLNWDLPNRGLYQFSFNYSGPPNYSNFSPSQTFAQASPQFTLTGSGISGLDGSYYITASATQCVWVRTDGSFAIIFKP